MAAFELARRPGTSVSRDEPPRELSVRQAQLPARVAAAKLEGAALVTHLALTHATMLSGAEARAIQVAPLGEARYRAIVDAFAGYAVNEINLLAFK